jgi:hypothetical protein
MSTAHWMGVRMLTGVFFRDFVEINKNANAPSPQNPRPHLDLRLVSWIGMFGWRVLAEVTRSHRGAVELAFDHDQRDVIIETNVATESCRAVKDLDRELFRRQ